jgi:hypothetical protein
MLTFMADKSIFTGDICHEKYVRHVWNGERTTYEAVLLMYRDPKLNKFTWVWEKQYTNKSIVKIFKSIYDTAPLDLQDRDECVMVNIAIQTNCKIGLQLKDDYYYLYESVLTDNDMENSPLNYMLFTCDDKPLDFKFDADPELTDSHTMVYLY